jgi:hypothetical protein
MLGNLKTCHNLRYVYITFAAFSFLIGVIIYILFRDNDLTILGLSRIIDTDEILDNKIVSVFIYNMPDGLWFLTGIFLVKSIWFEIKKISDIYIFILFIIALLLEFLQLSPDIKGTFDIKDIVILTVIVSLYYGIDVLKIIRR